MIFRIVLLIIIFLRSKYMSNENEKNEIVPGLNVTKPELEMLRNEPEAFERYTKF